MKLIAIFLFLIINAFTWADIIPMKPKLKGLTVESLPFAKKDENNSQIVTGFVVELMDQIAQKCNFEYEIKFQEDGHYGKVDENGTVNGMIGEVYSQKADFAIGDLSVTGSRKQFVQFTEPIITTPLAALIRRDLAGADFASLEDIVTYNEVQEDSPDRADNEIGFVVVGHGVSLTKILSSEEPTAKKIANWLQSHPSDKIKSRQEGVERVTKGRTAMVLEATFAEYVAAQNCSLVALPDKNSIFNRDQAIALKKDSPYLGPINQAIKELKEDGTMERLKEKYWKSNCQPVGKP